MSTLRKVGAWLTRWQMTVVLIVVTAVFVVGLRATADLRRQDARIEREAALRFCEDSNKRTALLRDFIAPSTADPDPRQYDFITDPTLRQGALDQARRGRAEMRDRVARTFTLRDCPAEFPAPPDGD